MNKRGFACFAGIAFAGLALAGCGVGAGNAAPPAKPTTVASVVDPNWPPAGMTAGPGGVAWEWTAKTDFDCKSYQDGCWGVTVVAKNGCPSGVYIEMAVLSGGAAVDKANEITAGLAPGGKAIALLSPPGGSPTGATGRVTKLNCLS